MQKRMSFTKDSSGKGILKAADVVTRLGYGALIDFIGEYNNLNSDEARAAYSKQMAGLCASCFEQAWPITYEVLNVIKEREIWKWKNKEGVQTYNSFSEYFEDNFHESFRVWADLESTYHFVADNDPSFFEKTWNKAKSYVATATERAKLAVQSSIESEGQTSKPGPTSDIRERIIKAKTELEEKGEKITQQKIADMVGVTQKTVSVNIPDNGNFPLSGIKNTQDEKANKSGISDRTQRKIDYLTREAKDLLQRTLLPKGDPNRLSIHGAYKLARGLQDPIQVMPDPEKIVNKLIDVLEDDQLKEVYSRLSDYMTDAIISSPQQKGGPIG